MKKKIEMLQKKQKRNKNSFFLFAAVLKKDLSLSLGVIELKNT